MTYLNEYIASSLKSAREGKGLSQRALSSKSGIPQGHISKIENGVVDLRVSSLVELARVLDLELALVPRKTLPAVQSIARSAERTVAATHDESRKARKELKDLERSIVNLPNAVQSIKEVAQLKSQVKQLQGLPLNQSALEPILHARRSLKPFLDGLKKSRAPVVDTSFIEGIQKSAARFQHLRNSLVHTSTNLPGTDRARPAHSLEDDDDD